MILDEEGDAMSEADFIRFMKRFGTSEGELVARAGLEPAVPGHEPGDLPLVDRADSSVADFDVWVSPVGIRYCYAWTDRVRRDCFFRWDQTIYVIDEPCQGYQ